MLLQYIVDPERNETLVEMWAEGRTGGIAFLVVNDSTRLAEMQFAIDGDVVKVPLAEFEEALQKAKAMLRLPPGAPPDE